MISPNLGEPPRPLRRIGSGGELSRALLAIKRVLASRMPRGLLVFDECHHLPSPGYLLAAEDEITRFEASHGTAVATSA